MKKRLKMTIPKMFSGRRMIKPVRRLADCKKATTAEDTMHIIFLFLSLSLIAIIFVVLVSVDQGDKFQIPENVEETILSQRILSSPSCFVFRDNVNRAYPGIIDISKFNQENFEDCFDTREIHYAFRVSLISAISGESEKTTIETMNWESSGMDITQRPPVKILVRDPARNENFPGELIIEIKKLSS